MCAPWSRAETQVRPYIKYPLDGYLYKEIRMTPEEVIAKVKARAKTNFRTGLN